MLPRRLVISTGSPCVIESGVTSSRIEKQKSYIVSEKGAGRLF